MAAATSLLTLDPAWSPAPYCFNDLWAVHTAQGERPIVAGSPAETSRCAPLGYTQATVYQATSCPTGYTRACYHTNYVAADHAHEAIAVCCPTAMDFQCSNADSTLVPQWCVTTVNETITTMMPTISLGAGQTTVLDAMTATLTPGDTIHGWGVLYVKPTPSPTPIPTRISISSSHNVETAFITRRDSSDSEGLSDYLKQRIIIAAVIVFLTCVVLPIAAVYRRRRILARLKANANGPWPPQRERPVAATSFFASWRPAPAPRSGERDDTELPRFNRDPVQQDNPPAPPPTYAEATRVPTGIIHTEQHRDHADNGGTEGLGPGESPLITHVR